MTRIRIIIIIRKYIRDTIGSTDGVLHFLMLQLAVSKFICISSSLLADHVDRLLLSVLKSLMANKQGYYQNARAEEADKQGYYQNARAEEADKQGYYQNARAEEADKQRYYQNARAEQADKQGYYQNADKQYYQNARAEEADPGKYILFTNTMH